jgi:transcription elongation factor GreA
MIETAIIVEDRFDADQVGLNKKVTVRFPGEEETETYKIVTTVRADSMEGRITPESPLGRALMGCRAGERAHVKVNEKLEYDVEIVNVENVGEEETDTLRRF